MNVVGKVTNNGGHIAPGNSIGTLTIDGALIINQGTLDMEIAPGGKSDKIVLTGPDGKLTFGVDTLNAIFEPGVYAPGTYTLVTTSQGVEGRIDNFSAENHPPNFISTAYNTSNEVLLTLAAALGNESVLGGAQTKLARQIDAVYNSTGVLPSNFAGLYGITGPAPEQHTERGDGRRGDRLAADLRPDDERVPVADARSVRRRTQRRSRLRRAAGPRSCERAGGRPADPQGGGGRRSLCGPRGRPPMAATGASTAIPGAPAATTSRPTPAASWPGSTIARRPGR